MTEMNQVTLHGYSVNVGDDIYCLAHGWGKVHRVLPTRTGPIIVRYTRKREPYTKTDELTVTYTAEGVICGTWEQWHLPTLYWGEPKFDLPLKKVETHDWYVELTDGSIELHENETEHYISNRYFALPVRRIQRIDCSAKLTEKTPGEI